MTRVLVGLFLGLLAPTILHAQIVGAPQSITVIDSGTACVTAPTACAIFALDANTGGLTLSVSGTWTGTLTFEGTNNDAIWTSVIASNLATGAQATTTTANGLFSVTNGGVIKIRARATAAITGSALVTAAKGIGFARLFGPSPMFTTVLIGDGTAAAPGLGFASETALGLRRTAAQTAYFSDNASATIFAVGPAASTAGFAINGGGTPSGITFGMLSSLKWTNGTEQNAADAFLRHVAAKSLTFDTDGAGGNLTALNLDTSALTLTGKVTNYNSVAGAGYGVPAIYGAANITAQSTNATITSYANGAADGDFEVSGQMNVTASTTLATTITCTYTDVASVARTMILPIAPLSGTFTAAGAISGAGASVWHTPVMHLRAKASTTITLLTSAGTFTGVTYSASGVIRQLQ